MLRVCQRLRQRGLDLSRLYALEFFAREGDWQTVSYASQVAVLEAWEINPACEPALRRNLPQAQIRIGDSYQLALRTENAARFDLVVFDNPQVTFGADDQYCEHFEALELVPRLLRIPRGIVIFNVNQAPYGYDAQTRWQARRRAFYRVDQTATLDSEFVQDFYRGYFRRLGLESDFIFLEPRHDGRIAYGVMGLSRALVQDSLSSPG